MTYGRSKLSLYVPKFVLPGTIDALHQQFSCCHCNGGFCVDSEGTDARAEGQCERKMAIFELFRAIYLVNIVCKFGVDRFSSFGVIVRKNRQTDNKMIQTLFKTIPTGTSKFRAVIKWLP